MTAEVRSRSIRHRDGCGESRWLGFGAKLSRTTIPSDARANPRFARSGDWPNKQADGENLIALETRLWMVALNSDGSALTKGIGQSGLRATLATLRNGLFESPARAPQALHTAIEFPELAQSDRFDM